MRRNVIHDFLQIVRLGAPLCLALIATVGSSYAESNEIKIGVVAPLTGDMAFAGEEIQNAMELALENNRGESLRYSYKLIFEDNSLDLARSATAAKKLIDLDRVDAIVTLWPPTANVVAPITEAAGVLHYTIAWDPQIARRNRLVLSHQAMVTEFVTATLTLLQSEGVHRLAFFQVNESGFNIGTELFKSQVEKYGITLSYLDVFDAGQRDFRTSLQKAKTLGVDGLLIWAVSPELEILFRQAREARADWKVTGFIDAAQDLRPFEGLKFVSEVYATDDFREAYRRRFGGEFSMKGPNAFDVMNLLIAAYESSPSKVLSASEVKGYLTEVRKHPGAVGVFSIDENGNSSYPPTYKIVTEGVAVPTLLSR